jgi:hypothetical protein
MSAKNEAATQHAIAKTKTTKLLLERAFEFE